MKIAYFNCPSGIAGDMIISSFVDAGLQGKKLEKILKDKIKIINWRLKFTSIERHHFSATHLEVLGQKHFKSPGHIKNIIKKSKLSDNVKKNSLKILDTLIKAESIVHKIEPNKVHFHELNSLDTLVDITGACVAMEMLEIDKIYASNINIGRPAPAALEILKDKKLPVYSDSLVETATPTGIAIISNLSENFGIMPEIFIQKSGYGAGTNEIPGKNNFLQVIIGTINESKTIFENDKVILLETNIDDMDPRIYPYVIEKVLNAGAKDAWLTQVLMKKGRPGIVLSVICGTVQENIIADIIFNETTTLGIRRIPITRHVLKRKKFIEKKTAYLSNDKVKTSTEFEQAKKKSLKTNRPISYFL